MFFEGRSAAVASDAEQGAEFVEWIEAPVKAERELIKVGLEMLVADTVMDADEPRFKTGEDEMYYRQMVLGNLRVATFGSGKVFNPRLPGLEYTLQPSSPCRGGTCGSSGY